MEGQPPDTTADWDFSAPAPLLAFFHPPHRKVTMITRALLFKMTKHDLFSSYQLVSFSSTVTTYRLACMLSKKLYKGGKSHLSH